MPVPQEMHSYQISHNTFDSCIKYVLGESFEVSFNGENLKIDMINSGRLYPKFTCEPIQDEGKITT